MTDRAVLRGTPRPAWGERVSSLGYRLARPVLFRTGDAEAIHERTVRAVGTLGSSAVLRAVARAVTGPRGDEVEFAGLRFPGPVGLAAGMDKYGMAVRGWASLGFSHVELGTVTAKAQPGNDKPRLFRLPTSRAVINRMGFNNPGAAALAERLASYGITRGGRQAGLVVGVSIGKSKVTPLTEAVEDYVTSLRAVAPHADYIAINVSSPNTPGLRSLQDKGFLADLTSTLVTEARSLDRVAPVPVLVKLAPDLSTEAVAEAVEVCTDAGISGLIATNTTIERSGLSAADRSMASQTGGLSGAPLRRRSREFVAALTRMTDLPVIGVGGIMSAQDADAMVEAGARLVQVYSGLVYAGPALVSGVNRRHGGNRR
ncbi:MAG TPA: quinone-dependent dihydroorotate dehydrogenase [Candidatus Avipropionibacterium avicola]|uniref:Dihydroorotate dehydrogenase (quinone) n=1 Tax=Candidatus Avipropionibacterium avicola TaxID=2840701 RepID=A0A9D1KPM2_9ACTN|nr:quinone-dependent dihydroorotate dehydrogenase [Candidatus Avipropionibacterium avicola]